MGASADQIDRQIRETRARMDDNLTTLEQRATRNAIRYGRIAVVIVGTIALGGAAFFAFRKFRQPALTDRLQGMPPAALRALTGELGSRLKGARKSMPSGTLTVSDRTEPEPGRFEHVVRKLAPAIIGTASTALIERATRSGVPDEVDERDARRAPPQAN